LLPAGFTSWIDPRADLSQGVVSSILLSALFPFAFVGFAIVFPKPTDLFKRYPWLPIAAGGIGFILVALFPTNEASWVWFVLSLVVSVGILIRNVFTMRDPVSRAQIRWGVGGIFAGLGTITVMLVINTSGLIAIDDNVFAIVETIGMTLMGVMLAVGISRYRLFDIDVLIRRTLQYTILTGLLALVYFGSVTLLQTPIAVLTGESDSPILTVITTLGIAALFNPLRNRVQVVLDRRFYRDRYFADQVMERFAAAARDEVDMDRLTGALVSVVDETMHPVKVGLWLRVEQRSRSG
jgi:hypothetical protein